jgi:hypothetical protein
LGNSFSTAAGIARNEPAAPRIDFQFSREFVVVRPWQPAFPQAMQRHGGQTRPAAPPVAKVGPKPPREAADENNRGDADRGTAPDKSSKSKD